MSEDNVVALDTPFHGEIPCDRLLRAAQDADLSRLLIVGTDSHGNLYFATSMPEPEMMVWLLECAKKKVMDVIDHD